MAWDMQVINEKAASPVAAMKPPLYRSPTSSLRRSVSSPEDSSSSSSNSSSSSTGSVGTSEKSEIVQEHDSGTSLRRSSSLDTPGSFSKQEVDSVDCTVLDSKPPPAPPAPPKNALVRPSPSVAWSHKFCKRTVGICVPKETVETWDRLFTEGLNVDVSLRTEDGGIIAAHSFVLAAASPVFKQIISEKIPGKHRQAIHVKGVHYDPLRVFIRFLYSSIYEKHEMERYYVPLLVLSHVYSVPLLKRACTRELELGLLTTDNLIDVLQLARLCDVPRLSMLCLKLVTQNFKNVVKSEGWRFMRESDQALEQELVGHVIETDARKQERLRKLEEDKVYKQLHDAMEALVHICRDGCRTIGVGTTKPFATSSCNYPACNGLESLVRHFASCKTKVSGGCVHCKRMWQLLELHSRMCSADPCKVPLCRYFKDRIGQQTKMEEGRWKLLVSKVRAARGASTGFSLAAVSATLEQEA